jgi:hypothetical protein
MLHLEVTGEEGRPIHHLWDRARRFADKVLRDEKGLATIMAMHHSPPAAVYEHQPHVHIMALARRFDGSRWGEVTDLAATPLMPLSPPHGRPPRHDPSRKAHSAADFGDIVDRNSRCLCRPITTASSRCDLTAKPHPPLYHEFYNELYTSLCNAL